MPLPEPTREIDPLYTLLPPNATKLEQDLLKLVPYSGILQAIVSDMNTVGETEIPTDWRIWILQQRGQLPLLEAFDDMDVILENSIYLKEHRGTVAAIIRICEMFGFIGVRVWEHEWQTIHFSEFQIGLGPVTRLEQDTLVRLEKALKFIKPLRCRFRRIYNGFDTDIRRMVLSKKKGIQNGTLGRQLLGHFSGRPSAHNKDLWIAVYSPNLNSYAIGGSGLTLSKFAYKDYGITTGPIIDNNTDEITDIDGVTIDYVSARSVE